MFVKSFRALGFDASIQVQKSVNLLYSWYIETIIWIRLYIVHQFLKRKNSYFSDYMFFLGLFFVSICLCYNFPCLFLFSFFFLLLGLHFSTKETKLELYIGIVINSAFLFYLFRFFVFLQLYIQSLLFLCKVCIFSTYNNKVFSVTFLLVLSCWPNLLWCKNYKLYRVFTLQSHYV